MPPTSPRSHADDFADFGGVAYLNSAYHGALPRVASAAAEEALEWKKRPFLVRDELHFDLPDAYRAAAAALIGARPEDVAVTTSAGDGISLVTTGLDWREGDEVVLAAGEFPSNRFPWLALAARGVVVREVDDVAAALTPRTRAVATTWVGYASGRRVDLDALGRRCRERGALLVVDGSQGVGGLPLDVRETPVDLLACAGYKWLLGPYGLGFAWVAPSLAGQLSPPQVGWFAIEGARDFSRLDRCELRFAPGARRFDRNEPAAFTCVAAGTASLRYLAEIGPAEVARHVRHLHDRLLAGLPSSFRPPAGLTEASRSNILRLTAASEDAVERAREALRERRVVVSIREGAIRVSPHLFNSEDDVDRLLEGLAATTHAPVAVGAPQAPLPVGEPVAPLEEIRRPARRPLSGSRFSLHPLDPGRDLDDLFAASHGSPAREALWTYMAYGPFPDPPAMLAWLRGAAVSTDPLYFAVVENAGARRIGVFSLCNIRPEDRRLELGHIWYSPDVQGTGVNDEAVLLALTEAFETLSYRRAEWKCDSRNARSRRAALRLGFRFEGVFRQHMIIKGRNRDTAWFSIVDSEWPAVKETLVRRVRPARPVGEEA